MITSNKKDKGKDKGKKKDPKKEVRDIGTIGDLLDKMPVTGSFDRVETGEPMQIDDFESYSKIGGITNEDTYESIRMRRAKAQSDWEQVKYGVYKGVLKGGLGAAQMFGYGADMVLDIPNMFVGYDDMDDQFGNAWTRFFQEQKDSLDEAMPVYAENPDDVFDFDDWAFYSRALEALLQNTIEFAVPGSALRVLKAGSMLQKAKLGRQITGWLAKKAKPGRQITTEIGRSPITDMINSFGAATVSNYMESAYMADHFYRQNIDKLESAHRMGQIDDYEEARKIIAKEAKDVQRLNYFMIGTQMVAFRNMLGKQRPGNSRYSQGVADYANNKMKVKPYQAVRSVVMNAGAESAEEVTQSFNEQEQQFDVNRKIKETTDDINKQQFGVKAKADTFIGRVTGNYLNEGTLYEGIMGAIGGPFQSGAAQLGSRAIAKMRGDQSPQNAKQAVEQQNERYAEINKEAGINTQNEARKAAAQFADRIQKRVESIENSTDGDTGDYGAMLEIAMQNFQNGTADLMFNRLEELKNSGEIGEQEKREIDQVISDLKAIENTYNMYLDNGLSFTNREGETDEFIKQQFVNTVISNKLKEKVAKKKKEVDEIDFKDGESKISDKSRRYVRSKAKLQALNTNIIAAKKIYENNKSSKSASKRNKRTLDRLRKEYKQAEKEYLSVADNKKEREEIKAKLDLFGSTNNEEDLQLSQFSGNTDTLRDLDKKIQAQEKQLLDLNKELEENRKLEDSPETLDQKFSINKDKSSLIISLDKLREEYREEATKANLQTDLNKSFEELREQYKTKYAEIQKQIEDKVQQFENPGQEGFRETLDERNEFADKRLEESSEQTKELREKEIRYKELQRQVKENKTALEELKSKKSSASFGSQNEDGSNNLEDISAREAIDQEISRTQEKIDRDISEIEKISEEAKAIKDQIDTKYKKEIDDLNQQLVDMAKAYDEEVLRAYADENKQVGEEIQKKINENKKLLESIRNGDYVQVYNIIDQNTKQAEKLNIIAQILDEDVNALNDPDYRKEYVKEVLEAEKKRQQNESKLNDYFPNGLPQLVIVTHNGRDYIAADINEKGEIGIDIINNDVNGRPYIERLYVSPTDAENLKASDRTLWDGMSLPPTYKLYDEVELQDRPSQEASLISSLVGEKVYYKGLPYVVKVSDKNAKLEKRKEDIRKAEEKAEKDKAEVANKYEPESKEYKEKISEIDKQLSERIEKINSKINESAVALTERLQKDNFNNYIEELTTRVEQLKNDLYEQYDDQMEVSKTKYTGPISVNNENKGEVILTKYRSGRITLSSVDGSITRDSSKMQREVSTEQEMLQEVFSPDVLESNENKDRKNRYQSEKLNINRKLQNTIDEIFGSAFKRIDDENNSFKDDDITSNAAAFNIQQIYTDIINNLEGKLSSNYDKFLLPKLDDNGNIVYKKDNKGNFVKTNGDYISEKNEVTRKQLETRVRILKEILVATDVAQINYEAASDSTYKIMIQTEPEQYYLEGEGDIIMLPEGDNFDEDFDIKRTSPDASKIRDIYTSLEAPYIEVFDSNGNIVEVQFKRSGKVVTKKEVLDAAEWLYVQRVSKELKELTDEEIKELEGIFLTDNAVTSALEDVMRTHITDKFASGFDKVISNRDLTKEEMFAVHKFLNRSMQEIESRVNKLDQDNNLDEIDLLNKAFLYFNRLNDKLQSLETTKTRKVNGQPTKKTYGIATVSTGQKKVRKADKTAEAKKRDKESKEVKELRVKINEEINSILNSDNDIDEKIKQLESILSTYENTKPSLPLDVKNRIASEIAKLSNDKGLNEFRANINAVDTENFSDDARERKADISNKKKQLREISTAIEASKLDKQDKQELRKLIQEKLDKLDEADNININESDILYNLIGADKNLPLSIHFEDGGYRVYSNGQVVDDVDIAIQAYAIDKNVREKMSSYMGNSTDKELTLFLERVGQFYVSLIESSSKLNYRGLTLDERNAGTEGENLYLIKFDDNGERLTKPALGNESTLRESTIILPVFEGFGTQHTHYKSLMDKLNSDENVQVNVYVEYNFFNQKGNVTGVFQQGSIYTPDNGYKLGVKVKGEGSNTTFRFTDNSSEEIYSQVDAPYGQVIIVDNSNAQTINGNQKYITPRVSKVSMFEAYMYYSLVNGKLTQDQLNKNDFVKDFIKEHGNLLSDYERDELQKIINNDQPMFNIGIKKLEKLISYESAHSEDLPILLELSTTYSDDEKGYMEKLSEIINDKDSAKPVSPVPISMFNKVDSPLKAVVFGTEIQEVRDYYSNSLSGRVSYKEDGDGNVTQTAEPILSVSGRVDKPYTTMNMKAPVQVSPTNYSAIGQEQSEQTEQSEQSQQDVSSDKIKDLIQKLIGIAETENDAIELGNTIKEIEDALSNNEVISTKDKEEFDRLLKKYEDVLKKQSSKDTQQDTTSKPDKKSNPEQSNKFDDMDEDDDIILREISNTEELPQSRSNEYREVKRMLPQLPSRDISRIADKIVSKKDRSIVGAYIDGAMYLATDAPGGTGYHEAFHAVSDMYLSDMERRKMYATIKTKEGEAYLETYDTTISFSQMTDNQVEEYLAQEFAGFKMAMDNDDSYDWSRVDGKSKTVFEKILDFIKNLFNTKRSIRDIFRDIDSGAYANKAITPRSSIAKLSEVDEITEYDIDRYADFLIYNTVTRNILKEGVKRRPGDFPVGEIDMNKLTHTNLRLSEPLVIKKGLSSLIKFTQLYYEKKGGKEDHILKKLFAVLTTDSTKEQKDYLINLKKPSGIKPGKNLYKILDRVERKIEQLGLSQEIVENQAIQSQKKSSEQDFSRDVIPTLKTLFAMVPVGVDRSTGLPRILETKQAVAAVLEEKGDAKNVNDAIKKLKMSKRPGVENIGLLMQEINKSNSKNKTEHLTSLLKGFDSAIVKKTKVNLSEFNTRKKYVTDGTVDDGYSKLDVMIINSSVTDFIAKGLTKYNAKYSKESRVTSPEGIKEPFNNFLKVIGFSDSEIKSSTPEVYRKANRVFNTSTRLVAANSDLVKALELLATDVGRPSQVSARASDGKSHMKYQNPTWHHAVIDKIAKEKRLKKKKKNFGLYTVFDYLTISSVHPLNGGKVLPPKAVDVKGSKERSKGFKEFTEAEELLARIMYNNNNFMFGDFTDKTTFYAYKVDNFSDEISEMVDNPMFLSGYFFNEAIRKYTTTNRDSKFFDNFSKDKYHVFGKLGTDIENAVERMFGEEARKVDSITSKNPSEFMQQYIQQLKEDYYAEKDRKIPLLLKQSIEKHIGNMIADKLDDLSINTYEIMRNEGIVDKNGDWSKSMPEEVKYKGTNTTQGIITPKEAAYRLTLGQFIGSMEYMIHIKGDIAFYGGQKKYEKRGGGPNADGNRLAESEKDNIRYIEIAHQETPSFNADNIKQLLGDDTIINYNKIDKTDGASIISPNFFSKQLKGMGVAGEAYPLLDKMTKGKATQSDFEELNKILSKKIDLQSRKGQLFGISKTDDGTPYPVYFKVSELINSVYLAAHSPKLTALLNYMGKNDVDMAVFTSGSKAAKLSKPINYDSIENLNVKDTRYINTIPMSFWKQQQPESGDKEGQFAKQVENLMNYPPKINPITGEQAKYTDPRTGETMDSEELRSLFNKINNTITDNNLRSFAEQNVGNTDRLVSKLILEELRRNTISEVVEQSSSLIRERDGQIELFEVDENNQETIIESFSSDQFTRALESQLQLDENGELLIPVDLSGFKALIESKLFAQITKKIIKRKSRGFNMIQAPRFDISPQKISNKQSNEIKRDIIWLSDSIKSPKPNMQDGKPQSLEPGEVLVSIDILKTGREDDMDGYGPLFRAVNRDRDDEITTLDELFNSDVDLNNILGERAKEFIGYRIPNQGPSSNDKLRIAGFLPSQYAHMIITYDDITSKTGSDFDIDKMYSVMPYLEVTRDEDGKLILDAVDHKPSFERYVLNQFRKEMKSTVTHAMAHFDNSERLEAYMDYIERSMDEIEDEIDRYQQASGISDFSPIVNSLKEKLSEFEEASDQITKVWNNLQNLREGFSREDFESDAENNPLKYMDNKQLSNYKVALLGELFTNPAIMYQLFKPLDSDSRPIQKYVKDRGLDEDNLDSLEAYAPAYQIQRAKTIKNAESVVGKMANVVGLHQTANMKVKAFGNEYYLHDEYFDDDKTMTDINKRPTTIISVISGILSEALDVMNNDILPKTGITKANSSIVATAIRMNMFKGKSNAAQKSFNFAVDIVRHYDEIVNEANITGSKDNLTSVTLEDAFGKEELSNKELSSFADQIATKNLNDQKLKNKVIAVYKQLSAVSESIVPSLSLNLTGSLRPSSAENQIVLEKAQELTGLFDNNENSNLLMPTVSNIDQNGAITMLQRNGEKTALKRYIDVINETNSIFSQSMGSFSPEFNEIAKIIHPSVMEYDDIITRSKLVDEVTAALLSQSLVELSDKTYKQYMIEQFKLVTEPDFTNKVNELKEEDKTNNIFLKYLTPVTVEYRAGKVTQNRYTFTISSSDDTGLNIDDIINDWYKLYKDSKTRDIATKLMNYSILSTGASRHNFGMYKYIHPMMMLETGLRDKYNELKDKVLKDPNYRNGVALAIASGPIGSELIGESSVFERNGNNIKVENKTEKITGESAGLHVFKPYNIKSISLTKKISTKKRKEEGFDLKSTSGIQSVKPKVDTTASWSKLKNQSVYTEQGVNTMRTSNKETEYAHFGNPFSASGYSGNIKMPTVEKAVQAYKDWLKGNKQGFKLPIDKTGKDQGKADLANAFIGYKVSNRNSSTGQYLDKANELNVPSNENINPDRSTVAFVSVASEGVNNQKTIEQAKRVIKAGGTIVMDASGTSFGKARSSFNKKGEGAVQDALGKPAGQTSKGYNYWGVNPEQRQWILKQINSGKLDNTTLLYDAKPSKGTDKINHAFALAEVVEELRDNQTTQQGKEEKQSPAINPNDIGRFEHNGVKISTKFELGKQQDEALRKMIDHVMKGKSKPFMLQGYAGTGKTTVITYLHKYLKEYERIKDKPNGLVAYVTPTHTANITLAESTAEVNNIIPYTVQSSFYRIYDTDSPMQTMKLSSLYDAIPGRKIIVIDEGSMLSPKEVDMIITASKEKNNLIPIFLADFKQLAAVEGEVQDEKTGKRVKYLSDVFSIEDRYELTEVFRQSTDDLGLMMDRIRGNINFTPYIIEGSNSVVNKANSENFMKELKEMFNQDRESTILISYTNKRVSMFNNEIRKQLGFEGQLKVGEQVIGYGGADNKQPDKGDLVNSVRYTVDSITKEGSMYKLVATSDKLKSLKDKGMGGFESTSESYILPFSTTNNLGLKVTEQEINKNKKIIEDIYKKAVYAFTNTLSYSEGKERMSRVLKELSQYNIVDDSHGDLGEYIFLPNKGKLEKNRPRAFSKKEFEIFLNNRSYNLRSLLKVKKGIDLGYAITIHKSQSSTYKNVAYDVQSVQAIPAGEVEYIMNGEVVNTERNSLNYVAASRAKNKLLTNISSDAVKIDRDAPTHEDIREKLRENGYSDAKIEVEMRNIKKYEQEILQGKHVEAFNSVDDFRGYLLENIKKCK